MMPNLAVKTRNINKLYRTIAYQPGITPWLKSIYNPKYHYHTALTDITLDIGIGESVGLIGPNGAGKSSLIKILCGIQQPSSGNVEVLGLRPGVRNMKLLREIGVIFGHKSSLWWDLPVIDSLNAYKKIYAIPNDVYQNNLQELVSTLNLEKMLTRTARNLSLGERVKCELAIVFLHNPKLVFLDEPTVGLDINSKRDIRSYINHRRQKSNTTILITSHDFGDIEACCDRVILIENGTINLQPGTKNLLTDSGDHSIIIVTPHGAFFTTEDNILIRNALQCCNIDVKIAEDNQRKKLIICKNELIGSLTDYLSSMTTCSVQPSTMNLEQKMLYRQI